MNLKLDDRSHRESTLTVTRTCSGPRYSRSGSKGRERGTDQAPPWGVPEAARVHIIYLLPARLSQGKLLASPVDLILVVSPYNNRVLQKHKGASIFEEFMWLFERSVKSLARNTAFLAIRVVQVWW